MKLIADSGSTKTDWMLIYNDGTVDYAVTEGYNPYFKTSEEIARSIVKQMNFKSGNHFSSIGEVHFYGAGCSSPEKNEVVEEALKEVFNQANVVVHHDLLAAARALCGKEEGIAAILGTGSNTCHFDGENIVKNVPALGFILGDEGSGACIGKQLVQDYLLQEMPQSVSDKFKSKFGLTREDILHKVYKEPSPNRFLASFTRWLDAIKEEEPYATELIENCMDQFFRKHIVKYDQYQHLPLNVVGSIGYHFKEELTNVARKYGVGVGKVIKSPMDGLLDYHR